MFDSDFRRMGCGRYGFDWEAPWGQSVPAEMMVVPARGWPERPESRDPRWATFPVGPTVVAIRLLGGIPTRAPSPSPKHRALVKPCH